MRTGDPPFNTTPQEFLGMKGKKEKRGWVLNEQNCLRVYKATNVSTKRGGVANK